MSLVDASELKNLMSVLVLSWEAFEAHSWTEIRVSGSGNGFCEQFPSFSSQWSNLYVVFTVAWQKGMLILKLFLRIGEQDWRGGKWLQTHSFVGGGGLFFYYWFFFLFVFSSESSPVLLLSINYKCYEGEHMNFLGKSIHVQSFHTCEMWFFCFAEGWGWPNALTWLPLFSHW